MRFLQPLPFYKLFSNVDKFTITITPPLVNRPAALTWATWVSRTSIPCVWATWWIHIDQLTKCEDGLGFLCYYEWSKTCFFNISYVSMGNFHIFLLVYGMIPHFGLIKYEPAGSDHVGNIDIWKRWFWVHTCYPLL